MSRKAREEVETGYCEECGMMLDSRYNSFDVDDTISGLYYGSEGEPLCRYHKDRDLQNDDDYPPDEEP